jgi:hypothetical protein
MEKCMCVFEEIHDFVICVKETHYPPFLYAILYGKCHAMCVEETHENPYLTLLFSMILYGKMQDPPVLRKPMQDLTLLFSAILYGKTSCVLRKPMKYLTLLLSVILYGRNSLCVEETHAISYPLFSVICMENTSALFSCMP